MDRKVMIVTGSNSGIGLRAAAGLARQGHQVVMMCRNPERGEQARQQIIADTQSEHVDLIVADLSSQSSINQAVDQFHQRYDRLDVLVNNAANFDLTLKKPQMTKDGVELIFATNHLGPFLLTNLLLDTLKNSAPSRVINIASKGLVAHPLLKIEYDNLNGEKKFSPSHAYYHSKLAQIMFTYDLARRLEGSGVTVNCIRVPNVRLDEGRYDHIPALLRGMYKIKLRFAVPAETMAEGYVQVATSPEFETKTGLYLDENCKSVKSSNYTYDEEMQEKLWKRSAELTGL